ncbi:MAG TPA: class C beta-lactamase-related serine hydrolase [Spirochaetes bacterium]|nr:class C beta-lactamase-related serine hydrolase [Spirochaetota bacterium]
MSQSSRPRKKGKIVLTVLGAIVGIIVIAALLNYSRISRLMYVLKLFEPDVIVENFRAMGEKMDSREMLPGETAFSFKKDLRPLPESYTHRGERKSVQKFIDRTDTTGLMVVRDDTILFEQYYRGNTEKSKAISWSVAKSFISALLGIAVQEGHIKDIKDPVTKYVPSLKGSGYEGVPIKDVMQMSSGIRFNEDYADFNSDINRMGRYFALKLPLDDFVASLKSEKKPGVSNHYVSMDTQVLGMLLREATGKTVSAYMEEKLWKPLGMEASALWLVDGKGMEAVFGGLNAVLRDYARFGRLYLKNGNWNGAQIVPAAWVKASVTPDAPHLMPGKRDNSTWVLGYGYQWWIPENHDGDFLAIGVYGQAIYIYPKYNIVIAKTSAYADYNKDGDDMEIESIEMFRAIARNMGKK